MAAIFVVGLPGGDSGMLTEGLAELRYDPGRFSPVTWMREAIMTTRTEYFWSALLVDCQHVRHAVNQPLRRSSRWGTEHHGQIARSRQIKDLLQPAKLIFAGYRFQATPSKFSDP